MVNMVWEKYQFSFNDDRQPNMVANLIVHDVVLKLKGILNSLNSYGYLIHSASKNQIIEEMQQSLFEHL